MTDEAAETTDTSAGNAGAESEAQTAQASASDVLYGEQSSADAGEQQSAEQESPQEQGGEEQQQESTEKKGILSEQEKDTEQSESESEGEDKGESEEAEQQPTYDFSPPEGIEVNEEAKSKFQEVAQREGISEEAAKELWDLGMQQLQQNDPNEHIQNAIETNRQQWVEQVHKDTEIGGDNLDKTRENAKVAIRSYGNEEFFDVLEKSGLESHPEVVRFLNKVGAALGEDQSATPGSGANQRPLTAAEILYGKN